VDNHAVISDANGALGDLLSASTIDANVRDCFAIHNG